MKLLFGFIIGIAVVVMVVALYCACVIVGRSDENNNNNEGYDDMFFKKQICPNCRTGKESYELDQHSETCPYIGYLKDGKCYFYVPLEKPSKKGILVVSKSESSPPKNRALHSILKRWRSKSS